MSFDIHTVAVMKGTTPSRTDRVIKGWGSAAVAAGSGAGASVTVTITPGGTTPTNPVVNVDPGQDATWYTTNYTTTSFQIVLNPRLAANTLAAGTLTWNLTA